DRGSIQSRETRRIRDYGIAQQLAGCVNADPHDGRAFFTTASGTGWVVVIRVHRTFQPRLLLEWYFLLDFFRLANCFEHPLVGSSRRNRANGRMHYVKISEKLVIGAVPAELRDRGSPFRAAEIVHALQPAIRPGFAHRCLVVDRNRLVGCVDGLEPGLAEAFYLGDCRSVHKQNAAVRIELSDLLPILRASRRSHEQQCDPDVAHASLSASATKKAPAFCAEALNS